MEEFNDFLQELTLLSGKLVLLGDFNFHVDEPERSDVSSFLTLLDSFGLKQHVDKPTHRSDHIIDLIITCDDEDLVRLCDVGLYHGSDHRIIRSTLQQRKPPPLRVKCTMRDFRNTDSLALNHDLNVQLNSDMNLQFGDVNHNVNDMLEHFNNVSLNVLDKYAPSATRSRLVRPRPPWYDEQIRAEKLEHRRLERKWMKSKQDDDRDAYRKQHVHYIKAVEASKKQYYYEKLLGAGAKETFQIIGVLLNQSVRILPTLYTPDVLSNKFGHFFTEKVDNIRASIISDSNVDSNFYCTDDMYTDVVIQNDLVCFRKLTQKEVRNIIMGCTNKSCHLDCLPTWLLKENIDVVLPRITQIVNTSITCGVFPDYLKQAIVTQSLKRPLWTGMNLRITGLFQI
ncbi:uncharacterized protein [Amphiura filiformis]|uniref:uncharacterized protein n=1 Tax=Amphiura filiformis TaxID=82378 RepID=UPI003B21CE1F